MSDFGRSQSGNLAMFFGLMLAAFCGLAGLGLDYARLRSATERLQAAVDSAAIAAKASGETDPATLLATAQAYFAQNKGAIGDITLSSLEVTPHGTRVSVKVDATLRTTLSAVAGVSDFGFSVTSEANASTEDLEVALVLDNTGSMSADMDDLRSGATDLVNTLFDNAANKSRIKVAVVPYVGAVNIGNSVSHMDWMDTTGDAIHHGGALEWMYFGYEPGCVYTPGGGSGSDPGSGTQGSLENSWPKFASVIGEIAGVKKAEAAVVGDVPSPFNFAPDCWIASPSKINLFDLIAAIPNTSWKGCVEARAEPYDVTDEEPSASVPDTLFVPWFWPDEIDNAALTAAGSAWQTANDYLPDRLDLRDAAAPKFNESWVGWGQSNVLKYNGTNGTIDESGPDTSGPNKSCPDPILPLTSTQQTVLDKIAGLVHWNGSGTNVAEGLAWGWRVLSPTEPFSEGAAYGTTKKVLVLMTDGINNVDPQDPDFSHLSHFSAYGYLQQWGQHRIPVKTYAAFKEHADSRLQEVCANAKAAGITVYTVAFNITEDVTLNMLRDCASQPPYAYSAATASELVTAFKSIASKLSELRLTR